MRCGRREFAGTFATAGARALAPEYDPSYAAREEPAARADRSPVQTELPFRGRSERLERVVSIADYRTASEPPARERPIPVRVRRASQDDTQGQLQLDGGPMPPLRGSGRRAPTGAPGQRKRLDVAAPARRLVAGAADLGAACLILLAVSLAVRFGAGFEFLGGRFWAGHAAAGILVVLAYEVTWAYREIDSPGVRLCGLRLVDFDGHEPFRRERLLRVLWAIASVVPGALGLVWSLVEADKLSWHDTATSTYLTAN